MSIKPGPHLTFLVLLAVCSFLALYHLDQPAFWDDEAATCTFARNIVNGHGYTGWDGRNFYGYHNGEALDQNFRFRDPPLGSYLVAVSFKLFGISDFTGRLPFAGCGILSLVALWALLRLEFEDAPEIALYGVAALGLSVTFLLSIRTARYYSISILSSLLSMLYYRRFLDSKRYLDALCFAVAAIAAFYSTYLLCAALLGALAVCHAAFHRKEWTREHWRPFGAAAAVFAVATVPYSLYYRIWARSDFPDPTPWPLKHLRVLWWNFRDINLLAILPWTAAAALAAIYFHYWCSRESRPELRRVLELMALAIAYVVALSVISPEQTDRPSAADFRYLSPIYPLLAALLGVLLWHVHRRSKALAIGLLGAIVACNALTLSPLPKQVVAGPAGFAWLLPAYIGEITHRYPTATEEVARYLRDNAGQDDLVMTDPDYMEYPLLWYMGDKVKICCQLFADSPLPLDRVRQLGAPVFMDDGFPDWLIFYEARPEDANLLKLFSRPYPVNGVMGSRHYHMTKLLPIYFDQTQRPELAGHSFGPITHFGTQQSVAIYHGDPWRPGH